MNPGTHTQSGFTLVESMVSLALLTAVVGLTFELLSTSTGASNQGATMAKLDADAARAMDQITRALTPAGLSTLVPASPFGSSTLTFQPCTGYAAGTAQFGAAQRIAFVPTASATDPRGQIVLTGSAAGSQPVVLLANVARYLGGEKSNGADDNGNGLVDESGLCFRLDGRLLTISLTVQGTVADGPTLTRTLTTSVLLRN